MNVVSEEALIAMENLFTMDDLYSEPILEEINLALDQLSSVLSQVLVSADEPKFDSSAVNITFIKGQSAVLPCAVYDKQDYQVIWMNPRRILISTEDRRVMDDTRMSIERPFLQDWNLHIRNVQVYDEGEYTCQINTDPIQIKRTRLIVNVPAEIDNKTSSNDITVREGQTVSLQCIATGVPEPSIVWYRKTPQTNDAREQVGTNGKPGEQLIIHNISRFCGGLYECEASNKIAIPVNRLINVDVEFTPEVTFRTPHKISQELGKETLLECFVTAFPQAVSIWKKNGLPVKDMAENKWKYRTEIYKEDHFTWALYLRIINLEASDFGTYSCEAENSLGKDSDSMLLYEYFVQSSPPTPPTTIPPKPRTTSYWRHAARPSNVDNIYSGRVEINSAGNPYVSNGISHISGFLGAGESYTNDCASVFRQLNVFFWLHIIFGVTFYVMFP